MSKYTTQLRWIVETYTQDLPNYGILEKINVSLPKIFDFDFPIFLESHRVELEKKIVLHYFNKEIGMETVHLWKLYLNERLNLIMPKYNQLYEITAKKYDIFETSNIVEIFDSAKNNIVKENGTKDTTGIGKNVDVETNNNSGSDNQNNLLSDTPQANYANLDYATSLEKKENTFNNTGGSNRTVDSNVSNKEINIFAKNIDESLGGKKSVISKGGGKSYTELLVEARNAIINIDMEIVLELKDLFMTIY